MSVTLKDIKGVVFLLILSGTIAFIFNHLSARGIALIGQWESEKGVISANAKLNTIDLSIEIHHPELVQQIVEKKNRMILDVRHKDFYDMGHLPGAKSFPLQEFETRLEQILKSIKKDTPILVYCSGIDCDASHTFANLLLAQNYTDVKVFPGGFALWREMGFEIDKDEE